MYAERRKLFNIPAGISFTREDVEATNHVQNPSEAVLALVEPSFGEQLDRPAGVGEGYSLRQHAKMFLGQFDKYGKHLPDAEKWRIVGALHDAGKPEAAVRGGTQLQHEYTVPVFRETLRAIGFDHAEVQLWTALISEDPIGGMLQDKLSPQQAALAVATMAVRAGVPVAEFFEKLLMFFKLDASSYTADAGGVSSLDDLFDRARLGTALELAPDPQRRVDELRDLALEAERRMRSRRRAA